MSSSDNISDELREKIEEIVKELKISQDKKLLAGPTGSGEDFNEIVNTANRIFKVLATRPGVYLSLQSINKFKITEDIKELYIYLEIFVQMRFVTKENNTYQCPPVTSDFWL